MYLQNLSLDIKSVRTRPKHHGRTELGGRPGMCGRGAPSSGRPAAVQDRRGARRPPDSLCLGVSVCLTRLHARVGAHTHSVFSSPGGRPQHLHLLTCHTRPLPGFSFPPGQAPSAMPAPGSLPVTLLCLSLCQNLGLLVHTRGSQTLLHILVCLGAFQSPELSEATPRAKESASSLTITRPSKFKPQMEFGDLRQSTASRFSGLFCHL